MPWLFLKLSVNFMFLIWQNIWIFYQNNFWKLVSVFQFVKTEKRKLNSLFSRYSCFWRFLGAAKSRASLLTGSDYFLERVSSSRAYSSRCQTSVMECFAKIVTQQTYHVESTSIQCRYYVDTLKRKYWWISTPFWRTLFKVISVSKR